MKYSCAQPIIRYLAQDEKEIKHQSRDLEQEVTLKTVNCATRVSIFSKITWNLALKVQVANKVRGNKIKLTHLLGFATP